jgi:hypothetical protein
VVTVVDPGFGVVEITCMLNDKVEPSDSAIEKFCPAAVLADASL